MKQLLFFCFLFVAATDLKAQVPLAPGQMNFLLGAKPNNIIYRDTVYMGAKQFRDLFYRTNDAEIIQYYRRHQTNKILGTTVSVVGYAAILAGLRVTSDNSQTGWLLAGGGLLTGLAGGYLMMASQQNLQNAVILFNNKHNKASLNLGIGDKRAGLALNF